jgi:hypothetical protein
VKGAWISNRSVLQLVLCVALIVSGPSNNAQADYCDPEWHFAGGSFPDQNGGGLLFDGERFVDFGMSGTFLTSRDGETWSYNPRVFRQVFEEGWNEGASSCFFGNGRYVMAVPSLGGLHGMGFYISRDLKSWERIPTKPALTCAYQAGSYLFSTDPYHQWIYVSLDGIHFYGTSCPGGAELSGVGYDETRGRYLAGLSDGSIGTSPDAVNWTWKPAIVGGYASWFAFGPQRVVALTGGPDDGLAESTDGTTWAALSVPDVGYKPLLRYGGGQFIVLSAGRSLSSIDGLNWTLGEPFDAIGTMVGLAFGAGRWIAKTDYGQLFASTDGKTWTRIDPGPPMYTMQRLIRAGSPPRFVALSGWVHGTLTGGIWTSPDGAFWFQARDDGEDWSDVAWGDGRFVAVGGYYNTVALSDDGVNWQASRHSGDEGDRLACVAYGGGNFVAASTRGLIYSSPDGLTWEVSAPPDLQQNEGFVSAVFGSGLFVLGSTKGRIRTSADGRVWRWANADVPSGGEIHLTHGEPGFIAAPLYQGYYEFSADGQTWENISPAPGAFGQVWFVNGRYLAYDGFERYNFATGRNLLYASEDGRRWTPEPESFPVAPHDLLGEDGALWGVGSGEEDRGSIRSVVFRGDGCMPTVTGVSPTQGPVEGGTAVSISGSSLSDVTGVSFGGRPASTFKVVSDNLITAVTTPHDAIRTAVTLTSPSGQSIEGILDRFTFTSENPYFEIVDLSWRSGSLYLTGYGFKDGCSIRIGGRPAPKSKIKRMPGGGSMAILSGGSALKAMLPKGKNVLITIDNPGEPDMTAIAIFAR